MGTIKQDLDKFTPRKEQEEALSFITDAYKNSPNGKFYLLDMSVGTGKSHLAMMFSNWYMENVDSNARVDIITAGKILQDQYDDTYDSICNLKGKENYDCQSYECSCAQGKEFNRLNKTKCEECPYDSAKNGFMGGKISLTNFHLYLIYSLYSNSVMTSRGSKVLIVDECQDVEEILSSFISIKINENTIKKLKFTNEYEIIKTFNRVKTVEQYVEFLKYLIGEISETMQGIEQSLGIGDVKATKRDLKISKLTGTDNSDVKLMSILTDLNQHMLKIELFLKEHGEDPHNWVLETNFNDKKQRELSLEPIWSSNYLDKYVWSKYDKVLLMSGTILDKNLFSEINGIDPSKASYHSIASPFLVKNRKI